METDAAQAESLLVTVEEAARMLKLDENTLYRMATAGDIKSVRIGSAVRIPRAYVMAIISGEEKVKRSGRRARRFFDDAADV